TPPPRHSKPRKSCQLLDAGQSDEFLDAEIEWCARMVRGRLGLALEQPLLVSDPRVELPPEFSGFVTG
ncbi:hypothetical protein, partial [Micrococcus lylae]|uniref:hypothetical protein n=1 Tax=Micrococcus lylae TaxID=1273 RepID=UPI001C5BD6E0